VASHSQEVPEQPNSTFSRLIGPARHEEEKMPNNRMQLTILKITGGGPATRSSVIYSRLAADAERWAHKYKNKHKLERKIP
jgi:hypothetical protein